MWGLRGGGGGGGGGGSGPPDPPLDPRMGIPHLSELFLSYISYFLVMSCLASHSLLYLYIEQGKIV